MGDDGTSASYPRDWPPTETGGQMSRSREIAKRRDRSVGHDCITPATRPEATLILTLLLACDSSPSETADDTHVPPGDDCIPSDDALGAVEVVVTTMPTVLRATWSLDADAPARLRFVDSTGRWVENEPGEGLMVGLLPNTDVPWQLVWEEGGEPRCSSVGSATTGPLSVPAVDVEGALAPGYVITPIIDTDSTLVLLDALGNVVWSHEADAELDEPMIRARLGRDRKSVLYHLRSNSSHEGEIVRLGLDGEEIARIPFPGIDIDWDELEDGRIAGLNPELRLYENGELVRGDRLVVTDGTTSVVLWNALDALGPDLPYEVVEPSEGEVFQDFSHCNGVSYDGEGFLISLGNLDGVARVALDGRTEWVLRADSPGFDLGPGEIVMPHSAMAVEGGVIVFNRGMEIDGTTSCANATVFTLDQEAHHAEASWSVTSDPCLVIPFLGHAQRLAGGETLVDYSSAGLLQQVENDGVITFNANLQAGSAFGFATHLGELGTPIAE